MDHQKIKTLLVTCIDNGKTVNAELFDIKTNQLTVILPGYQKLTLKKNPDKPTLYTANQFGMEFYTNYP